MYTYPIIYLTLGSIFLIVSIYLFLKDYKKVVQQQIEKRFLFLNIFSILCALGTMIMSVIYFFVINNQL
ncbi:hypothetical protein BH758_13115 [Enterococcus hirae]|uniref:hypothetical protein n=1 Tax=Enterococcus sp. AZ077 TaxID=2774931 RepID=UPI0009BE307F|nr:hypothetical protein BH758_13115 [Enterococcus hirae]OQO43570.1 hypothetical protein BH737_12265 [Enterococcus hirae]OQO48535.1 hypothetical protein BH735_12865 [Enterococcus hirae]OQO51465.1 hypothetical protein BH734_13175 [Enterococcus hirae]OQO55741.1 hypothetical protein BHG15_12985 [Enterococcus hirae]